MRTVPADSRLRPATRRRAIALAVAAGVTFAACGDDTVDPVASDPATTQPTTPATSDPATSEPAGPTSLDGRTFLSTATTGFELVEGTQVRIQFVDGRFSMSAGCNIMGATYELDGDVLRLDGGLEMTEMGCEEALAAQDSRLADLMSSEPTLVVEGDTLTLTSASASISLLDREVADPDRPLEQTAWTLTGVVTGDAVSSVPMGATPTLTIEGGTALVDTGCNTGSAPVAVDGDTLTFGPLALTKMACEPELMDLEAHVASVLSGTATFTIEAASLTVSNGDLGLTFGVAAA